MGMNAEITGRSVTQMAARTGDFVVESRLCLDGWPAGRLDAMALARDGVGLGSVPSVSHFGSNVDILGTDPNPFSLRWDVSVSPTI